MLATVKEFRDRTKGFSRHYVSYIFSHCYNLHKEYMDSEYETTRKLFQLYKDVDIKKEYGEGTTEAYLGIYSITEHYHPNIDESQAHREYEVECDCVVVEAYNNWYDSSLAVKFHIKGNRCGEKSLLLGKCRISGVDNLANTGLHSLTCFSVTIDALRQLRKNKIKTTYKELYFYHAEKIDLKLLGTKSEINCLHTDFLSFCLMVKNISQVNSTFNHITLNLDRGHRVGNEITKEELLNFLRVYFSHKGLYIKLFKGKEFLGAPTS